MANMASLVRKVETRGGFIAQRLALDLELDLKLAAGPHRKTGRMADAIRVGWSRTSPVSWRITADVPVVQAATTDRGARAHVIVPRKPGGVLRFDWPKAGGVVFLRKVNHPGNRPFRWFSNVMNVAHVRFLLARFVGR